MSEMTFFMDGAPAYGTRWTLTPNPNQSEILGFRKMQSEEGDLGRGQGVTLDLPVS